MTALKMENNTLIRGSTTLRPHEPTSYIHPDHKGSRIPPVHYSRSRYPFPAAWAGIVTELVLSSLVVRYWAHTYFILLHTKNRLTLVFQFMDLG